MTRHTLADLSTTYKQCLSALTYTSTAGVEALIEGCNVGANSRSEAYSVRNREEWLHQLSWQNFPAEIMATKEVGDVILSGYDIARHRAENGLQEIPREKMSTGFHTYTSTDPRVMQWK